MKIVVTKTLKTPKKNADKKHQKRSDNDLADVFGYSFHLRNSDLNGLDLTFQTERRLPLPHLG